MMNFYKSLNDLSLREMVAIAEELYNLKTVTVEMTNVTLVFGCDTKKWKVTCENKNTGEIFVFKNVNPNEEIFHAVVRACYYSMDSL